MTQLQENLREWLGIKSLERGLSDLRKGTPIPKGVGHGGGHGSNGSNAGDVFEPAEDEADDDGDNEGLGKPLQPGDEAEKLELKDCATGEPVTLDGLGGEDVPPVYPSGFNNCEPKTDPTYVEGMYWRLLNRDNASAPQTESAHQTKRQAAYAATGLPQAALATWESNGSLDNFSSLSASGGGGYSVSVTQQSCSSSPNPVCDLPPPTPKWNPSDKNHLVYDPANNCFTPLCGSLNDQVSQQYQGCNDELILCDKDGNKVNVKINEDGTVDVTQEKFGQTATVRDGKVTSVKKLTETQSDKIFK